jgi:GH18 family chitinase
MKRNAAALLLALGTGMAAVFAAPGALAQGAAQQWVTGYYGGYAWHLADYQAPQHVDMTAMTHFVFARIGPGGGKSGAPGQVVLGADDAQTKKTRGPGAPDKTVEQYMVDRAHQVGTKALIMLGGEGDNAGFTASTAPAVRAQFVKNLVDYMVSRDYDGIDVDWEGIDNADTESQSRLEALIAELRTEANARPRYQANPVIITFPADKLNPNYQKALDHHVRVANLVDQFNIMSYGMAYVGRGWQTTTFAALSDPENRHPLDIARIIQMFVDKGIPRSKIGMGIGFYALAYKPPFSQPGQDTADAPFNAFSVNDVEWNYAQLNKHGYLSNGILAWDANTQMGYRTYQGGYTPTTRNTGTTGYISYETPESIAAKGAWSQSTRAGEGAAGTIVWLVNYGTTNGVNNPLMTAVKRAFLDPNATDPGPNPNPDPNPPPPPPPPILSTQLSVTNDWTTGYCASLLVTNSGGAGEWAVTVPFKDTMSSLWGGTYTLANGQMTVRGPESRKTIGEGETREVGFCAVRKPVPPEEQPQPQPGQLIAKVTLSNDWKTGYCANIVVSNSGTTKAVKWSLPVAVQGTVTSLWNGKYVQAGAGSITLSGPDWKPDLAAGASSGSIGFCATR